jgi:hypothetical protein
MVLLDIHPKSRKSSYVWEHGLKTIFAMTATFGLIFFILMSFGYQRGGGTPSPEMMRIKKALFEFFLRDHVEITALICAIIAILMNLIAVKKNKRQIHIVKIEWHESSQKLDFEMISVYNDIRKTTTVALEDLQYLQKSEILYIFGKNHFLEFKNKKSNNVIGRIDQDHDIHTPYFREIKTAISALAQIKKPEKTKKSNRHSTFVN